MTNMIHKTTADIQNRLVLLVRDGNIMELAAYQPDTRDHFWVVQGLYVDSKWGNLYNLTESMKMTVYPPNTHL